jgi:hypothetical protein
MERNCVKSLTCISLLVVFCLAASLSATPVVPHLANKLLAKAKPDECFKGVGLDNIYPFDFTTNTCDGTPKVNQAYVWGLAKAGQDLWFGTAPNVHCLVIGGYLEMTDPIQTSSYVCELGSSKLVPPLPASIGDWRPAEFWVYNLTSGSLTKIQVADPNVQYTVGIRAAGTLNGVVVMGGPSMLGGINMFYFNAATKEYLGSKRLPYENIRKFAVIDNVLYTTAGPRVLRWTGDLANPHSWVEVGNISGSGAELCAHEGRIFVATWPAGELPGGGSIASLWMSPVMGTDGLNAVDATGWRVVWTALNYEPDQVIAATYGGGALASFQGYLYWGTMHVPFLSTEAHMAVYGEPADNLEFLTTAIGCHRAIAIFRGKNFGKSTQVMQVCYGEKNLPVYDSVNGWTMKLNKMGTPLYGTSGFGNFFNNYTWTMAVFNNCLFVGTMDWSYLAFGDSQMFFGTDIPPFIQPEYGADLYAFTSSTAGAKAVYRNGVGNYLNYGIRTMIADDNLYLGTSNPMNLMTSPTDGMPDGGWELRKLYLKK